LLREEALIYYFLRKGYAAIYELEVGQELSYFLGA
jgi:hypothetical protein